MQDVCRTQEEASDLIFTCMNSLSSLPTSQVVYDASKLETETCGLLLLRDFSMRLLVQ